MSKSKFLYIFPSNYGHDGINVKLDGQLDALHNTYTTRLVTLNYTKRQSAIQTALALFSFECRASLLAFRYPRIYMRYNPKTPYTLFILSFLSFFKTIYIEHNTLLDNELRFLNRKIERALHHIVMFVISKSNLIHIAVNEELQEHLINDFSCSKKQTLYIQNGFKMPKINTQHLLQEALESAKKAAQITGCKTAIFTGNGYPWHGLDKIIELVKDRTDLHLLIAGPYKADSTLPKHIHLLGKLDTATLYTIYELCDFAISTFSWDILGISDGSPLKTREYLCMGLPILTNYHDSAEDFLSLQPYIFNYKKDPKALEAILSFTSEKKTIQTEAQVSLSWKSLWKKILLD
jgi:hypothetical protein